LLRTSKIGRRISVERSSTTTDVTRRQKASGVFKALSEITEVGTPATVAVLCVESRGQGFGPDGRMIIREKQFRIRLVRFSVEQE
jgi:hypothetical protein